MYVSFKKNIHMASEIHNRIEHIIDSERLSISAFECIIGVGRNSISSSLSKKSSIFHKVIRKIHNHFPKYYADLNYIKN